MQYLQELSSSSGTSNRVWLAGFAPSHAASILATSSSESQGVDTVGDRHYREHLSTRELISEVRKLLAMERHVEWLLCRYLADLADRICTREDAELEGYVDEFHAARCFFQLGVRTTRERVRI